MHGYVLVEPRIGDETPGWFILDTGANVTCVERNLTDHLPLEFRGTTVAVGAHARTEARLLEASSIQLGPVIVERPVVAEADFGFISEALGYEVLGLCGTDLLADVVLEIEPRERRVSLYPSEGHDLPSVEWEEIRFHQGMPLVHATFEGGLEGWFIVDTATALAVVFSAPAVERLGLLRGRSVSEVSNPGVGGSTDLAIGKLGPLELAGHRLDDLTAGFSRSGRGTLADAPFTGIIGQEVLSQFVLLIDFPGSRMSLRPIE